PEFEGYGPKTSKSVSEDISNEVKEYPDVLLVKKLASDDKLEKETVFPTVAKIEFGRPKQQEKPVRKTIRERVKSGNNYTRVTYNNSTRKTHPSAHRKMAPRAVLMKNGLRPLNTARPVNTAHPKTTVNSARPMVIKGVVQPVAPTTAEQRLARKNELKARDASEGFNQIIDFLNTRSIKYALTVNPNIYVSCIKHFWTSVSVTKVNDVTRLQALVDKKRVIITEAIIRDALRLDDAEGIDCLPNEEIFTELARMGYEKSSNKLTFYKAFFSTVICLSKGRKFNFSKYIFDSLVRNVDSSTKFYIYLRFLQLMIRAQVDDLSSHTTKHSSPVLTQKVFANMRRVGKGCSRVEIPLFKSMVVAHQVDEGDAEVNIDNVSTAGVVNEGATSVTDDVVPAAVDKPSIPSPTPPTQTPQPTQDIPFTSQMVKKLEGRNKLKVSKLRRLKKVGTAQRVDTSDDTVMDNVSKQGRIIADMDADVDVTLKDIAKDVAVNAEIEESIDVLSMQDDEVEPFELQEVAEVVTNAKLITEVVTAASATIVVAAPQLTTAVAPTLTTAPSAARRIKGVDEVIDQVQRKEKEDNDVMRYQLLKRKPQTKAQARKNMMIYLRNVAGFKMDYFKRMNYDDIRPIFEKKFNSNVAFLQKTKEQMKEEDSRALKRISETQEEKAAKK
nr:hypothetical protein [Tanacetum cinerariifolium]